MLAYRINTSSTNSTYRSLYYVQTADIDLSAHYWDAIGYSSSYYFSGHYDGGGFVISGVFTQPGTTSLYSYQGLFGYVLGRNLSSYTTIHNIEITNSYIQGYQYVGSVVGYVDESDSCVYIYNCVSEANVSGISFVGGIFGGFRDTGRNCHLEIYDCQNTGDITGSGDYVGGIAGHCPSSYLYKCYNSGNISGYDYVGGVAGYKNIYENYSSGTNYCFNIGNVNGNSFVGGIIGYNDSYAPKGSVTSLDVEIMANHSEEVNDCYNTGDVTGQSNIGGICGYSQGGNISHCYNTGSIVGVSAVGGICGLQNTTRQDTSGTVVYNSFNLGDIQGEIIGAIVGTHSDWYVSVNSDVRYSYWGGECTVNVAASDSTGTNCGTCTIENIKTESWYQSSSRWSSNWDFESTWTIVGDGVNGGFPVLQWSVDIINNPIDEIYNDAEGKMDEENVGRLLEYLLGESDVDVTAKETMDKLNALAGSTMTSADIRDKNDGTDITVRFGGLDWTVTYLSKDNAGNNILTLWLSSSQQDAFSGRTATEGKLYGFINNSLYSDWSNDWSADTPSSNYPSNMYGTSYIRAVTLNNGGIYTTDGTNTATASQNTNSVFARFTMDEVDNSLTKFLVKPGKIEWQRYQSGVETMSGWAGILYGNDSLNDPNDIGLKGDWYSSSYNYKDKTGYQAWANDYIWLPSITESGFNSTFNGLWETSTSQRQNYSSSTSNNSTVGSGNVYDVGLRSYSWLRSTNGSAAHLASYIFSSGEGYNSNFVSGVGAVRPALHLNLNDVIKDILGIYTVTLDDNGGSGGDGEIFATEDGYYADEGMATKIEGVTVPSFTAHKFLGYFTEGGQQVTDANGVITMTSSQFTEATTLYAHWEARNPAHYDSEGGFWYVENGKLPQSKVGESLKATLSGQWSSLSDGSVYYMGVEELADGDLTTDGGMQSKVYDGEEYVKFNGEFYLVEPIRWRLVYSSSQQEGYAVENTSVLATMAEIVFLDSYSSTKIGVGAGYSAESVTMLLKNQVSDDYLVNEDKSVDIFGTTTPKDTTTVSGSVFVASSEELANFTTNKNNTTGSGVKPGKVSLSDFVKDYLRATGQGNYYFTRDLGDQLNTIRCLNPVGDRSQAKAQQTLGVQFTIKVTEYACKEM